MALVYYFRITNLYRKYIPYPVTIYFPVTCLDTFLKPDIALHTSRAKSGQPGQQINQDREISRLARRPIGPSETNGPTRPMKALWPAWPDPIGPKSVSVPGRVGRATSVPVQDRPGPSIPALGPSIMPYFCARSKLTERLMMKN